MNCLCCSSNLLRHVGRSGLYNYCPYCRQSMPSPLDDGSVSKFCLRKKALKG